MHIYCIFQDQAHQKKRCLEAVLYVSEVENLFQVCVCITCQSLESNRTQYKVVKIADMVLLSLVVRDIKSVSSLT